MRQHLLSILFALLVFPAIGPFACGQSVVVEPDEDRKLRLADNLKLQFRQLRESDVVVQELGPSDVSGFDQGIITIDGRRAMRFIVTEDDRYFYLLAAEPVDVSLSSQEVALRLAAEEREEARQADERHAALLDASKTRPSRGPDSAPVTIVEFSDFQCPYCARASRTVEQLLEKHPENVRLIYMHFPLNNHPWAEPAAIASVCAADQSVDAFWLLHDFYFAQQGQIDVDNVMAKSRGQLAGTNVDLSAWATCSQDAEAPSYQAASERVRSEAETGRRFGVSGTPGFFVNGRFLSGAQPLSAFEEIIEEVLARTK